MTTSICGTFYRNILTILHLLHQFLVLEAFRFLVAEPALAVFLIFRIRSLEEIYLGISFESQDMGCNPVQEPPVVRDYHGTSGKILQTFLQSTDGIYIHIVGRLVQKQHIALVLEREGQVETIPLTTGKNAAEFLLICT